MKLQEIYDRVRAHLLNQGERAGCIDEDEYFFCRYREKDLKCAVGCLITDEHYSHSIEDHSINHSRVREAVTRSLGLPNGLSDAGRDLLDDLQHIHDDIEPELWEEKLFEVQFDPNAEAEA